MCALLCLIARWLVVASDPVMVPTLSFSFLVVGTGAFSFVA